MRHVCLFCGSLERIGLEIAFQDPWSPLKASYRPADLTGPGSDILLQSKVLIEIRNFVAYVLANCRDILLCIFSREKSGSYSSTSERVTLRGPIR